MIAAIQPTPARPTHLSSIIQIGLFLHVSDGLRPPRDRYITARKTVSPRKKERKKARGSLFMFSLAHGGVSSHLLQHELLMYVDVLSFSSCAGLILDFRPHPHWARSLFSGWVYSVWALRLINAALHSGESTGTSSSSSTYWSPSPEQLKYKWRIFTADSFVQPTARRYLTVSAAFLFITVNIVTASL